jgi:hypothetical protein
MRAKTTPRRDGVRTWPHPVNPHPEEATLSEIRVSPDGAFIR